MKNKIEFPFNCCENIFIGNKKTIIIFNGNPEKYVYSEKQNKHSYIFNFLDKNNNNTDSFNQYLAAIFVSKYHLKLKKYTYFFANYALDELENNYHNLIENIKANIEGKLIKITNLNNKLIKELNNEFLDEKVQENFFKELLSENGSSLALSPVFLKKLFETNLLYLFDYKVYPQKLNKMQKTIPVEVKNLLKEFILEHSFVDSKVIKTLINRSIYKYKATEFEIYELINLLSSNKELVEDFLSSQKNIKQKWHIYKDLMFAVDSTLVYERYINIVSKDINWKKSEEKTIEKIKNIIPYKNKWNDLIEENENIVCEYKIDLRNIDIFPNKLSKRKFYEVFTYNNINCEKLGWIRITCKSDHTYNVLNIHITVEKEKVDHEYNKFLLKKILERFVNQEKNILKDYLIEQMLLYKINKSEKKENKSVRNKI